MSGMGVTPASSGPSPVIVSFDNRIAVPQEAMSLPQDLSENVSLSAAAFDGPGKTMVQEFTVIDPISFAVTVGHSVNTSLFTSPAAAALKTIHILYTNDIHGAITPIGGEAGSEAGGVSRMATIIRTLQQQSGGKFLLLDGGDWGQGSYESGLTRGKTLIEVMNSLGYDAAEMGNHEFDWGRAALKDMIENAHFPILASNVLKDGELLENVKPYAIKEIDGIKIGVIGVISSQTPGTVDPRTIEGLEFGDSAKAVKKYLPELQEQGVDITVVLSHQGDKEDVKLAKKVSHADVIVGGHSHSVLDNAIESNKAVIVQAGTGAQCVGDLQLQIDPETRTIMSYNNVLIPVKDVTPDPEVEKIISAVVEEARVKMAEVVGTSEVDLTHDRQKVLETVLGNVLTDAMREAGGSDIAFENAGGIRAEIQKGTIRFGDLYRVLPFDKALVSMDLQGSDIKSILENSADRKKGNLQVSGVAFDIDSSRPHGEKVSHVKIGGAPLDLAKTYRVTIDDFLAGGANGYSEFTAGRNVTFGDPVVNAFKNYIKTHSPLTAETACLQGRINFIP